MHQSNGICFDGMNRLCSYGRACADIRVEADSNELKSKAGALCLSEVMLVS
jgi:hypothetical protein